jgi:ATP-dependent DNA helicase RecG
LAGLPKPVYFYDMSGFFVEFRKDNYNEQYLKLLDLSNRLAKVVLYVKEKGKITNQEYQKMFGVARMTAAAGTILSTQAHPPANLPGQTH